jgi:methylated-DNA-protein-cysteine methyltransferase related protein
MKPRPASSEQAIYAVVRSIPRGQVATYGQIAELVGIPSGHRVVARAMRTCPERLPWQRVVGKKDARRAQIVLGESDHGNLQRALLEAERVVFDANGFISLRDWGWQPEQHAVRQPRSRGKGPQPAKRAPPGKRAASHAPATRSSSGRKKAGKHASIAKGKMPRRSVNASDR